MQKFLSILPHSISIGTAGIGLFGFIEVPWHGVPIMIGGEPIDPLLMKSIYLFLILVGSSMAIGLTISGVYSALKGCRDTAIRELEEISKCGEEMIKWGIDQKQGSSSYLSAEPRLRHIILSQKYKNWFIQIPNKNTVEDTNLAAANCAETMRAYGYIRGRWKIRKGIKEWNRNNST